jgi:hypothetical protein
MFSFTGCIHKEDNYLVVPTSTKVNKPEYATNWKFTVKHNGYGKPDHELIDEEHVEYAQSSNIFYMDVEKGVNMPSYSPWFCWQEKIYRFTDNDDKEYFGSGFHCRSSDISKDVIVSIEAQCYANEASSSIKDISLTSDIVVITSTLSVQCETVRVK